MEKSRYHYRFRALTDPPTLEELEAGPFTPDEAAAFGQKQTYSKLAATGKAWVGDWSPIADKPPLRIFAAWGRVGVRALIALLLLAFVAYAIVMLLTLWLSPSGITP